MRLSTSLSHTPQNSSVYVSSLSTSFVSPELPANDHELLSPYLLYFAKFMNLQTVFCPNPTNMWAYDISSYRASYMEPYRYWNGKCCCRKTPPKANKNPTPTIINNTSSKHVLQGLYCPLTQPIGLGMIGCAQVPSRTQFFQQLLLKS